MNSLMVLVVGLCHFAHFAYAQQWPTKPIRFKVVDTLLKMGAPPESSTPEQLTVFLREEIKKFAEVIAIAGAKID